MNSLQEFMGVIRSKLGSGYVYGGQSDNPLTKEALIELVKRFGKSHYYFNSYSAERWLGKEYYDCSGLVVYTLRKMGLIENNEDYTAQGIFSQLCEHVVLQDLQAGDLCFNKTGSGIVHVGVYMGNSRVVHARGTFYGVVETQVFSSFNTFGRLKFFANEKPEAVIKPEKSIKKAKIQTMVNEQPFDNTAGIGSINAGSLVNVTGKTDNGWYQINLNGKTGFIQALTLEDYSELANAIAFLSQSAGIDNVYWYNHAADIKWLDVCFIKIAKAFGANLN
ncbi:NlpC/P60 family protein [Ruminiclostridium cellulolyticum]|uniref:NLP/P60 protein n=1 Tax=Ruminiclostridium cellulolyticum (strain ATCC 35319 / DSM 5812 / JCM 6584 / H10) TaxID=394503 RepID=B8I156_RUMCH|nr:NlpC/P60 family protein [Ruminiclostridium cellulolyticum]ACL77612.1 NLP/P60 protein [Ruminiclostridium cellulolyticum H10]